MFSLALGNAGSRSQANAQRQEVSVQLRVQRALNLP